MNDLFGIFDPSIFSNKSLNLNWIAAFTLLMFYPSTFWLSSNMTLKGVLSLSNTLNNEFSMGLGKVKTPGIILLSISVFTFILLNNVLGLLPWVFTSSSHIVFTMSLAFPLWLGYILYSIMMTPSYFLSHLVPLGTPGALMPLMVCIELVSNLIRPMTLSVRLMANMVAGHLLLSLISNFLLSMSGVSFILGFPVLLALVVLECAVAGIQAYVFSLLVTLYIAEMNTWNLW